MTRAINRTVAAVLLALALAIPVPGAAQRRDRTEMEALLLFLQSLGAQRAARLCERGVPGYRQRFDDVYTRWSAKHRSRVARGEALFREGASAKDQPYLDHAKIEQIENAIAELAQAPRDTSPLTLDERTRGVCEEVLTDLEAALRP